MNLLPLALGWAVLATGVLVLAVYRRLVSRKEDDYLHVNTDVAAQQTVVAKKLENIDRWGKVLTVIVAILGLALLALFMYNGWTDSSRIAG